MDTATDTKKKPSPPTYGQLCQKHPEYDGELWTNVGLLYRGGWEMLRNASRFIEQAPRERSDFYKWRLRGTSYINYFARLVGYLTGSLFNETLNVGAGTDPSSNEPKPLPDPAFYERFSTDCDLTGTDFSQFMRTTLTDALVYRRALVQVDLPRATTFSDGSAPANRAQEEELGLNRAYLIALPIESMFDWEKSPDGRYVWCVLHRIRRDRATPLTNRKAYQHEFKLWWMADGLARYAVLRTKAIEKDDELQPDDELQIVEPERLTSFTEIPIRDLDLPEALWVGNQAGPLCQEHFRRRSDLMGAMGRSLVEIPFVKLGPEIPAVHGPLSEAQSNPNRGHDVLGRGKEDAVIIGSEDEIGFAGPSGRAFELARTECRDVREEIFASVNAMALQLENTASAVRRSGESKAEDRGATAIILTFLAQQTREFAQQVMGLVSSARRETVEWKASGLDTFDQEDRAQILEEASLLESLRIPSPTLQLLGRLKLANAILPNATAKEKTKIRKELEINSHPEEFAAGPLERGRSVDDYMNEHRHRPEEEELG